MFGMRQLKGLKLSQIILKYLNILPAKFDFEKVKQNKVRENLGEVSKMDILAAILDLNLNHIFHFYVTHDVQYIQIQHFTTFEEKRAHRSRVDLGFAHLNYTYFWLLEICPSVSLRYETTEARPGRVAQPSFCWVKVIIGMMIMQRRCFKSNHSAFKLHCRAVITQHRGDMVANFHISRWWVTQPESDCK